MRNICVKLFKFGPVAQEEMSYNLFFSFSPGSLAASLFWVAERFVQF